MTQLNIFGEGENNIAIQKEIKNYEEWLEHLKWIRDESNWTEHQKVEWAIREGFHIEDDLDKEIDEQIKFMGKQLAELKESVIKKW